MSAEVKHNSSIGTHLDLGFQKLGYIAQLFFNRDIIAHPVVAAACLTQFIAMPCAEPELVHENVTFRGNLAY